MNRICEEGQPKPIKNALELLPTVQTKLLLQLYRDQTAHNSLKDKE